MVEVVLGLAPFLWEQIMWRVQIIESLSEEVQKGQKPIQRFLQSRQREEHRAQISGRVVHTGSISKTI